MKQVLMAHGKITVQEVPAPLVEPGSVLVRLSHSCISAGTELAGVDSGAVPLWRRALREPENVRKVFGMVAQQGWSKTRNLVQTALDTALPSGYSAAGVIAEVGAGVTAFRRGQRVACAGAQCAHHAEVIRVPHNLCVAVPDGVSAAAASTVTLGAIALQGVRRAQPTLGECFVVIGLGILGLLTVQLLKANGCRVIGADLDPIRVRLGEELGMDHALTDPGEQPFEAVSRLTGGIGADGVIITAATPSDAVVASAFRSCRRKGRVVLVGDVGLQLRRDDFYPKELDFLVSTSYGPGRYDPNYEERGLDYPVGYVRWTENRNMAEYLRLLAAGQVQLDTMLSATHPVEHAAEAFAALRGETTPRPLLSLLSYPDSADAVAGHTTRNPQALAAKPGQVRLALVGAGAFARDTHLPNLRQLSQHYQLRAVVSRSGHNASEVARQFGAAFASTDYQQVLADPEVDAVLIATRHHLHAAMALAALRAGKHVLLEKPLALTREELAEIQAFYRDASSAAAAPMLLTGFNRRFSPCAQRLRALLQARRHPALLSYRMNAGHLPLDHWVHGTEGGGRNLGEAVHIYDLFTYLLDARVCRVQTTAIGGHAGHYSHRDNFVATASFEDGSVASLTYTALGAREHPKEQLEVFSDGRVLVLDDYRALRVVGATTAGLETRRMEKGHREELEAFAAAISDGGDWPIPLWQQVQATEMAFQVERALRGEEPGAV